MLRGITRIKDEELIIQDTLDHFGQWCDEIYVYDDCSTDKTMDIVKAHPKVAGTIQGTVWDTDRERAEWEHRQKIYEMASQDAKQEDWFIYFDADERLDFDQKVLEEETDYIVMRLFDYYITEDDKEPYISGKLEELRKWIGPEYRDILMWFRKRAGPKWHLPDQRMPSLTGFRVRQGILHGFIRHYGKSISIEHWEDTCRYYANHFPKYAEKWKSRQGKAIHTESDFGRPLITWTEKEEKGLQL